MADIESEEFYEAFLETDPENYRIPHFMIYGSLLEQSWRKGFEKYVKARNGLESLEKRLKVAKNVNSNRELQRLIKQDVRELNEDLNEMLRYLDLAIDQEFHEEQYSKLDFNGAKAIVCELDSEIDEVNDLEDTENLDEESRKAYEQFKEAFESDRYLETSYFVNFEEYKMASIYFQSLICAVDFENIDE